MICELHYNNRVATTPENLLEFEIAPGYPGNLLEFDDLSVVRVNIAVNFISILSNLDFTLRWRENVSFNQMKIKK